MITVDGILVLYGHPLAANAPTIMEHVTAFGRYSRHPVWKCNVDFGFPRGLNRFRFKAIVLHYSIFGSLPFGLSERFVRYLRDSRNAIKVAFFQDEMQYVPQRFKLIDELGIDVIYSLLEPRYFDEVYFKNTAVRRVFHTLTGYVDDSWGETSKRLAKPLRERTTDVSYRARPLPFYMGRGAQEKTQIADRFVERARGSGLILDIKTGAADRIYGEAWYRFLANSRAALGVEAGVSVFDMSGETRARVERLLADRPTLTFEEVHDQELKMWEDRIHYRTISPRVFEAAGLEVCQILFEGGYQGILHPSVHYIPLKKDFSNFDEVIAALRDDAFVLEMTARARRDLVDSGHYGYRGFIERFDDELAEMVDLPRASSDGRPDIERCIKRGQAVRLVWLRSRRILHKEWPGKSVVRRMVYGVLGPERQ